MSWLTTLLRRMRDDERGNLVVEGVLVMPMLIWAHAALFTYWDAYSSINRVQKASFTISDLMSRQQNEVNAPFITGMRDTMDYLIGVPGATKLRVTSYVWDDKKDEYKVLWSQSPGNGLTALTTADLNTRSERLPILADGDSAVLVETKVHYTPPMDFGVSPKDIDQFIVTRPRFLTKICHHDFNCNV